MSKSKPIENSYQTFEDEQASQTLHESQETDYDNQRIETVLIKVNCSSCAFQMRSLALYSIYNFFTCMQNATFLFMFLSPKFFVRDASGQGKPDEPFPSRSTRPAGKTTRPKFFLSRSRPNSACSATNRTRSSSCSRSHCSFRLWPPSCLCFCRTGTVPKT